MSSAERAGGLAAGWARRVIVRGALRRGGTAGGTAALVAGAALVVAALAWSRSSATSRRSRCPRLRCAAPAPRSPSGTPGCARSPSDAKKLVLIVVDGMTPAAFERAVESGRAPTLALLPSTARTARDLRLPVADARLPLVDRDRVPVPTYITFRISCGGTAASGASSSTARRSARCAPQGWRSRSPTRSST